VLALSRLQTGFGSLRTQERIASTDFAPGKPGIGFVGIGDLLLLRKQLVISDRAGHVLKKLVERYSALGSPHPPTIFGRAVATNDSITSHCGIARRKHAFGKFDSWLFS
jgi:hypothetical protein